jgi:DNA-binding transcriptional MerR regulator
LGADRRESVKIDVYVKCKRLSADRMPTYTITELAREFAITPRAIRFYEDRGLLAPRRVGAGARQREYSARDRTRLRLTLRGKRLGLSLAEIRDLIDRYDLPSGSAAQLERFLEVLAAHRARLERQLADLQETLGEIAAHETRARELLAQSRAARAVTA